MSEGPDSADIALAVEEKEEPHGVTDGRCNWCGQPTKERIKALSDNIRELLGHYDQQQATTAKLFEICLEFLEDKGHGVYYTDADVQREGGVFKAAKAAGIKRRERKQQLIAAIKGYIKMINEREKHEPKGEAVDGAGATHAVREPD